MIIKVVLAPLSNTILTANDLIKLNVPLRFIFQGFIAALSFVLNIYLFANMEEGKASSRITTVSLVASFLIILCIFVEIFYMISFRAYRTSRVSRPDIIEPAPPPSTNSSPSNSSSLALSLRLGFLSIGIVSPFYYITYAISGESKRLVMGESRR